MRADVQALESRTLLSAALLHSFASEQFGHGIQIGNTVYFTTVDNAINEKLWKTDGTAGGSRSWPT